MTATEAPLGIVHVLAPAYFGGLERVVQNLATGQRARGHDVRVLFLLDERQREPLLTDALRDAGVPVQRVVTRGRAYRRQLAVLRSLARDPRVHVIHSHGYLPDVLVRLALRARAPIVSTIHGFTGSSRIYEWMQLRALRAFDAVVPVSATVATRLAGAGVTLSRIHVVRNAWSPVGPPLTRDTARQALGIPADAPVLGWVGRISREKGLDVLLEALPLLPADIELAVVGDGPLRAALTARAESSGVGGRVTWCGTVPDAERYLAAFDTLVISSRTEGTPMTLLAAMDARVPVVSTAVGGIPAVVSPAEASLVPPDDAPALAEAIRDAITNRESATARAHAAHARLAREFDAASWLDTYDALYRQVCAGTSSNGSSSSSGL